MRKFLAYISAHMSWIAGGSILLLLALRIYSIFFTVHVVTWDDRWFRQTATYEAAQLSFTDTLAEILLPNTKNLNGERSRGYHTWLMFVTKVFPESFWENAWHLMNLGFLILQGVLVFLMSRWASSGHIPFSLLMTFLYLSSPIVFGINRFIMTENHTMTAVLLFTAIACFLLEHQADPKKRDKDFPHFLKYEIALPVLAGYLFGVFSTVREWALPNLVAIPVTLFIGLILQKRVSAALSFGLTLSPFLMATSEALVPVIQAARWKSDMKLYFHPLYKWIPHVLVFTIGVALTGFFGYVAFQLYKECRKRWKWPKSLKEYSAMHLLLGAHIAAFIVYCIVIITSKTRVVRPAVPPMLTFLLITLISMRLFGLKRLLEEKTIQRVYAPLLLISWAMMTYELFFAFEGGKDYRMHPFPLERYNHPLHLWELKNPDEMHVIPAKPYWEYL